MKIAVLLQRLIALRQVSSPAVWGKLPGHADFVRSGVRHGESDAWRSWLMSQGEANVPGPDPLGALPTTFVLPPGTLAFAPHQFVLGVIAPSMDRVGRYHPLLVYQTARAGWVHRHFSLQAVHPRDWFYWLARVVRHHVRSGGDAMMLERAIRAVWLVHAPTWPSGRRPGPVPESVAALLQARSQAAFDECAGTAPPADPASRLVGVRHLPWADWPNRLERRAAGSAFWQQDLSGGYVAAAFRLKDIWEKSP